MQKITRRAFLTSGVAALGVSATFPLRTAGANAAPNQPAAPGLSAYQIGPQLWVRLNNQLLASYRAHPTQKYPYVFPLAGPVTGLPLTSETAMPWPHHRSLFFGCDKVNGFDFWSSEVSTGKIISTELRIAKATPELVEWTDRCEWRSPKNDLVMEDRRSITVTVPKPTLTFLDWRIDWTAAQPVTIAKSNHSLFSMRAAPDIVPTGGGRLVDADGRSGEKETFGQKSAWLAFYGPRKQIAGQPVEGISIMDHPKNKWAPNPWFTRDYGFGSPTPLNFIDKWQWKEGESVRLEYRVVLFGGAPEKAGLAAIYKDWTNKA